ncbi:hypothetical protein Skr01_72560 [Sphaerisporangium krabiense]|uniref:Uncharacterized protein n=1 Tax=Sphaerisporangium krabiense TaxID=763782 RepID=A0A7W8Z781_9ACTN|nr:hypothetical protein [Sphaerisporangium krabiense]MBB5628530.1 hypothetical protein [Sphaerisporangium krabiense]GII67171.1 hypothetical protein Skr01_72560 [Sphaerisporangium krabiense]
MLKWDTLSPGEKRAAVALAAMLPGYVNAVFVAEHLAEAIAWRRGELTDEQLLERTGWAFNATPEQYADMALRSARRAGVDPVEWLDAMKGAYEEQRAIAAELEARETPRRTRRGARDSDFWEIVNANTWPDISDEPTP